MSERGRILLVGGIRSGKSRAAEHLLTGEADVTYLATGHTDPDDEEWTARVAAHRVRRPAHWRTLETFDVAEQLRTTTSEDPPLLLDCVNLWLTAAMERAGCWAAEPDAAATLANDVDKLVAAWSSTTAYVVAVTNEVGMSLVPTTRAGRWFAEELGDLNRRLAETADEVWQITVGIATRLR